jgi:hypothetical protein
MIKIEVSKRLGDSQHNGDPKYHAQIAGRPEIWAAGISMDEAIGNLIRYHQDTFDLECEYLGSQFR